MSRAQDEMVMSKEGQIETDVGDTSYEAFKTWTRGLDTQMCSCTKLQLAAAMKQRPELLHAQIARLARWNWVRVFGANQHSVGGVDAEDVTSEALMVVNRSLERMTGAGESIEGSCGSYARAILQNAVVGVIRHIREAKDGERKALADRSVWENTSEVDQLAARMELQELLDTLPTRAQEAIRMYHLLNMKQDEIADVLGITQPAVSQIIKTNMKRLRKAASDCEVLR